MNKNIRWLLFIHTDLEKQQLFKVLDFQSIKEIGYILDMKPQIISNYYHNLTGRLHMDWICVPNPRLRLNKRPQVFVLFLRHVVFPKPCLLLNRWPQVLFFTTCIFETNMF